MITYNNKQINGLFSKLDKAVTTAAKSAFTQAALNEKPALLSFDNSETNLMTYTAIRTNNVYANTLITTPKYAQLVVEPYVVEFTQDVQEALRNSLKGV